MKRAMFRRGALALQLLLLAAAPLAAQGTAGDTAFVRATKADLDSIARDRSAPQYSKRAQSRIRARADSLLAASIVVAKPPADTAAPPVVVTPGAPPGTIFSHPFAPLPNGALFAELPRDTVSLDVPAPTRTIRVVSLQQAYDTARAGDRLLIPANHTTNDLYIHANARAGWVTIQGTDSTSVIQTAIGGATSAVNIESRAHHVRFLGPLTIRSQTNAANALVRSYNGETAVDQVAHHIILDGVTIDMGQFVGRRCAWPDGAYMAIVRSRLLNCASQGGDAQAILIGNGPGPYRFDDNYLEGGHQCVMSGGFDPSIPQSIPSDVVFRRNRCVKPLRWHFTTPGVYTGQQRQVKTGIETKNIRRALIEGNVIENVWADAQAGFGGLIKSENQSCGAPWSQSVDVTVRYNRFINTASGINLSANPGDCKGVNAARITVYDNTFGPFDPKGDGMTIQLGGALSGAVLVHNTFASAGDGSSVAFDGGAGVRTVLAGNLLPNGAYGVKGTDAATGTGTITRFMPGGLFLTNVVYPTDCAYYPATTVCALTTPLPLAWDGRPVGADLSKVAP